MAKVITHEDVKRALDASDYESNIQSTFFRLKAGDVLTEKYTNTKERNIYGPCRVYFYRYVDGSIAVAVDKSK
jgi:hypothetical protein